MLATPSEDMAKDHFQSYESSSYEDEKEKKTTIFTESTFYRNVQLNVS